MPAERDRRINSGVSTTVSINCQHRPRTTPHIRHCRIRQ
jgi:hypothetical protein